jgi:hypothetical protein
LSAILIELEPKPPFSLFFFRDWSDLGYVYTNIASDLCILRFLSSNSSALIPYLKIAASASCQTNIGIIENGSLVMTCSQILEKIVPNAMLIPIFKNKCG